MISNCKTAEEASEFSKACHDLLFRLVKGKKPVVSAIMCCCGGGDLEGAERCSTTGHKWYLVNQITL